MPITKSTVLPSGVSGDFWVIRGIYVSPDGSGTRAFAQLYENAGAAVTGTPIHSKDILLTAEENPLHVGKMIDLVEAKLVALGGDFVSGVIS